MEKKFAVKQKQIRKSKFCPRGKHFGNYLLNNNSLDLPRQTTEQKNFCKTEPRNRGKFGLLKYMSNNKTPLRDKERVS